MKVREAVVVSNPRKKEATRIRKEVERFLSELGVRIVNKKKADMLVTVSGDGTILYNKDRFDAPIFGIGSEKSFICQARAENWKDALKQAVYSGRIEERMMLSSRLDDKRMKDALNEVVVRNRAHRILELKLVAGKKEFEFRADGVIFSTPTGSSAYAYSCGGIELEKTAMEYEVVAIAPFRRAFTPLIVSENDVCTLEIRSECDAHAVIDGQFVYRLKRKSRVEVWKSKRKARLFSIG
ncbi:MAG: NAD(+)/NADH kinase [Candidatus Anstonellales archaeon]